MHTGLFNQTNTTNFVFEINDGGMTEPFTLNGQGVTFPGVHIPVDDLPAGTQGIARAKRPGSTIEFDPLIVRFLVDKDLKSWLGMYQWMLSLNNYITHESKAWHPYGQPELGTLHILNNDKTEIVMSVHFYGLWPSDLSEIEYSITEEQDIAMVCTATIPFKYMQIEIDGKIVSGRPQVNEAALSAANMRMHPSMR